MSFSIFPRTIYQTKSEISGEIVVKKHFGQTKLYVQGVLQSGGIVEGIWKKPLKKVAKVGEVGKVEKVLILGLGGGTVVGLVKKYWPKAKIVGVEIDLEIVKVGKRFFDLKKFKNLEIVSADAFEWLALLKDGPWGTKARPWSEAGKTFDLIVVDLYLGKGYPKKAESKRFFKNIKKFLSEGGIAIFNRLQTPEADLAEFEKKLKDYFSSVEKIRTHTNSFLIVRK